MRIYTYVHMYVCGHISAGEYSSKGVFLLLPVIFHIFCAVMTISLFYCCCLFAMVICVADAVDLSFTSPNEIGVGTLEWLSIADELIIKFSVEINSYLNIYFLIV